MEWLLLVIGGLILVNQVEKRAATSPLNSLGGRLPAQGVTGRPYYRVYPVFAGVVAGEPEQVSTASPVSIQLVGTTPLVPAVAGAPAGAAASSAAASSPSGAGSAGGGGTFGGGGRPGIGTRVRVALL